MTTSNLKTETPEAVRSELAARPGIFELERWRRFQPSGGVYLAEIDGLRFVAIMSVIFVHLRGLWITGIGRTYPEMAPWDRALDAVTGLGGYGVELFFVISGFVLALPFLKHAHGMGKKVSLRSYFLRRLTRLEPPYIFSMLLFFAVMPHVGKGSYEELLPHLLASLAYVHEWVYRVGSFINNNAWSLEIEVQFYSLVPLLLGAGWKHHALRRGVLVAFLVCASLHSLWLPVGFPRTLLAYFQFFAMGILLCERWLLAWRDAPRDVRWDAVGALAALGFFGLTLAAPHLVSSVANPWLMGLFTTAVLRGRLLSRALTWGWIPIIGGMCYTIYLFHARVISLGMQTLFRRLELTGSFTLDYLILAIVIVPTIFGVSALFYAAIERPCMSHEWPRELLRWLAQRRLVRAVRKE